MTAEQFGMIGAVIAIGLDRIALGFNDSLQTIFLGGIVQD